MMRWSGIAPDNADQVADELRPQFMRLRCQRRTNKPTQRDGSVHPLIVTTLQQAAQTKKARLTGAIQWCGDEADRTGLSRVSAKLHGFIQMTESILAQGLNSGCNSQMLSNSDKSTVVISTIVKFTVVLTKLQILR